MKKLQDFNEEILKQSKDEMRTRRVEAIANALAAFSQKDLHGNVHMKALEIIDHLIDEIVHI